MYLALALPCAQCGLRFFASASGKKKMDQHLDWHFKHKRRVREAAGRTAGRGWFTGEEVRLSLSLSLSLFLLSLLNLAIDSS